MILTTLLSGVLLAVPTPASAALPAAAPEPSFAGDVLAIRVGRAETISQGTMRHAVVLVEDGKITAVGEDLPIERGIPILDRPDWVLTPGLVNCYSRLGMDSQAGRDFAPDQSAEGELYLDQDVYRDVVKEGVTTLGLYPPGTGIPGLAIAIKLNGTDPEKAVISKNAYLKIYIGADATLKKMVRDAWDKVADYEEKVEKAKEKWEKEQERKKKSKSKDEKKEEGSDEFVPPEVDPKIQRFIDLENKRFPALMRIQKAADYLHMLDVVKGHDIDWTLRCPLRDDVDLYQVADKVGEAGATIVLDPDITLQPATRRDRNIPDEMARAGAKVALIPRQDSVRGHEQWMKDVGEVVRFGMDRQTALAAVTLVPAQVLGLGDRLGSLDVGKDADLVFWTGDPFEPESKVAAVMLDGNFVYGNVD